MPRLIECDDPNACALEECVEALRAIEFDPACEERTDKAALWLRRLGNNRSFLGDHLIEQLRHRHREETIESGYGPQAIVLSPLHSNVFIRANIWPSPSDHCFQASGARSFVYGIPHDHNFSFLTLGYFGPGYRSDYYEYDYQSLAGDEGEKASLRFVERSALEEGKLMLYRAHVDVHSQIPPESLSISLNIMHVDPVQHWFDQYGFDCERDEIQSVLSPNTTEVFLRIAVGLGGEEALDLAAQFGKHHPSDRLRFAAYEARALRESASDARDAIWREAEISGNRLLALAARRKRAEIAA